MTTQVAKLKTLAEESLHLYAITKDPLTFSAASLVMQTKNSRLTEPQQTAVQLLERQLEAYRTIFPNPLV